MVKSIHNSINWLISRNFRHNEKNPPEVETNYFRKSEVKTKKMSPITENGLRFDVKEVSLESNPKPLQIDTKNESK